MVKTSRITVRRVKFRPFIMQSETSRFPIGYFSDWLVNSYPSYRPSDRMYRFNIFLETFDVRGVTFNGLTMNK